MSLDAPLRKCSILVFNTCKSTNSIGVNHGGYLVSIQLIHFEGLTIIPTGDKFDETPIKVRQWKNEVNTICNFRDALSYLNTIKKIKFKPNVIVTGNGNSKLLMANFRKHMNSANRTDTHQVQSEKVSSQNLRLTFPVSFLVPVNSCQRAMQRMVLKMQLRVG